MADMGMEVMYRMAPIYPKYEVMLVPDCMYKMKEIALGVTDDAMVSQDEM